MTGKNKFFLRTAVLLLSTCALGAVIALLTSRWLVLRVADLRLASYAQELLRQDELLALDITTALNAANKSVHASCSEADLGHLRMLLFRSFYLKDIGRLKDDMLLCSSVGGVLPKPIPSDPPDLVTDGGRKIYFQHELALVKGYRAQLIATANASVVVDPYVFTNLNRPPMYYAGYVRSLRTNKRLYTYNNFPSGENPDLVPVNSYVRRQGVQYYSACSATRPDCVVVGIAIADVLRPSNHDLLVAATAGALLGAACCIVILLMERRWNSIAGQLRRAVRRGQLRVCYQPIVDIATEEVIAAEALVRWPNSKGEFVDPEHFIALAEERGIIREITKFVVMRVMEDMEHVVKAFPSFRVSVNLSAQDLTDATLFPMLDGAMAGKSVSPGNIGFELTERSTADLQQVVSAIRKLRQRGHTVSIDDFGTGYSSLSYLNDLSVDTVKVDRAFTCTIGTGSIMESIVPQILSMAEGLRLQVVVEGIETREQVDYLSGIMPGLMGQGWLYGRACGVEELLERLERQAREMEELAMM